MATVIDTGEEHHPSILVLGLFLETADDVLIGSLGVSLVDTTIGRLILLHHGTSVWAVLDLRGEGGAIDQRRRPILLAG